MLRGFMRYAANIRASAPNDTRQKLSGYVGG